ncbi:MAG TPA: glycosyltransferase family 2 protein [Thermoanaerobaculia bacterium]
MKILSYVAFVAWAFAFANTILNLLLLRRPRVARLAGGPFVSIIVPARNEERAIERTVRALLAQEYSQFEVIAIDDRSADATGAILERIASEDPRLIVIHGEEPPAGWLGKPWALHQGSRRGRGEMLLFVDADVHYEPQTLRTAVEDIEATGDAMVFLFTHFVMRGFWENAIMPSVPMTPFAFPIWLGQHLPLTYLGVGGGTGNLIRRAVYDDVRGHEALRDAVIDDVGLAHHVRRSGYRTGLVRTERLVSVRMYHGLREILRGFTKNMFAVLGRSYFAAAATVVLLLAVHLMPYALALRGDRIALATIALILATRVIFFAALRYPIWNALLLHPFGAAAWIWITLRSTWITGVRGRLPWRGRTYDAASTRFGAQR